MTAEELIIKSLENAVLAKENSFWSDLIKIGLPILGTVIGAFLGYSASKNQTDKAFEAQIKTALLARNTELDTQFLNAKLEHFINVQNLIDEFANIVADYCANVRNWNDHNRSRNLQLLRDSENKHNELQSRYYKGFLLLGSAESKILILGKELLHETFQHLDAHSRKIYQLVYINNKKLRNDEIMEMIDQFKSIKYKLFKEIGQEIEYEHNNLLKRSNKI